MDHPVGYYPITVCALLPAPWATAGIKPIYIATHGFADADSVQLCKGCRDGQKKGFFHFGTQFFTFGFFCTSSIFLFGLRRRRHSVCTLNATIGSSILSEIFGNHKLSYYIVVHTTESIVLCAAAAATAV